ncbi:RNA polymerase III Rpc82 C -terminal [Penicillium malachiteum]|uniref:RNA polymerase III Rpc82 C -terminal n=1 Tax=Penicillium malachiteum TaxID=1324776 RepID=UPI0025498E55|nr:RNA polymerase III Rpc82 C -terminal [Penicillium malachiteum]KAJ5714526.1 RNA polymerase III Rpc82 C -terminal [Penicillium malachiteum]
MTSQYGAELCALLIEEQFGELFARIFSTLQRYERLTLPRLKFHARLADRQLRAALTAMIQHHLIYHFTSLEDNNTYYEANPQAAYYLVRSGKILNLVEDRLGEYAARVMEMVLFLGHASVNHLETLPELRSLNPESANGITNGNGDHTENGEEFGADQEATNGNGTEEISEQPAQNGHDDPEKMIALLHSTLRALASHGYLDRVREAHFQSPSDNILEAQRAVASRPDIKALKGKRQQEAIANDTDTLLKERTHADLTLGLMVDGMPRGVKRKFRNGASDSTNGAHLANGVNGNGTHAENDWAGEDDEFDNVPMESGLVVRVNYQKLDVALRNDRFVTLAQEEAPPATTEVYECLLRRFEYVTKQCRDTVEIPREGEEGEQWTSPIDAEKLLEDIDPALDLSTAFAPAESSSSSLNQRGKRPLENGINGDHDNGDEDSGPSRAWEINQHLHLLAQPPFNLTSCVELYGVPKWRVGFRGLARKLRSLELERMIESRYGDVALRVIRVLHAKGKLDEKRLQEISFLPWKDLRQTLSSMQTGGFVDLQEVPKDAQRQPSKTIFLWYYDPDRVCGSVLEDTYKAMSRTMQRIKVERERLKDFLEKTERSDVKGHEEEYLTEEELERLQRWKDKEALLLAEVARLDDMVAVFRDY